MGLISSTILLTIIIGIVFYSQAESKTVTKYEYKAPTKQEITDASMKYIMSKYKKYKTVGKTYMFHPEAVKLLELRDKDLIFWITKKPEVITRWKTKKVDTGYKGHLASYWYKKAYPSTRKTLSFKGIGDIRVGSKVTCSTPGYRIRTPTKVKRFTSKGLVVLKYSGHEVYCINDLNLLEY